MTGISSYLPYISLLIKLDANLDLIYLMDFDLSAYSRRSLLSSSLVIDGDFIYVPIKDYNNDFGITDNRLYFVKFDETDITGSQLGIKTDRSAGRSGFMTNSAVFLSGSRLLGVSFTHSQFDYLSAYYMFFIMDSVTMDLLEYYEMKDLYEDMGG